MTPLSLAANRFELAGDRCLNPGVQLLVGLGELHERAGKELRSAGDSLFGVEHASTISTHTIAVNMTRNPHYNCPIPQDGAR